MTKTVLIMKNFSFHQRVEVFRWSESAFVCLSEVLGVNTETRIRKQREMTVFGWHHTRGTTGESSTSTCQAQSRNGTRHEVSIVFYCLKQTLTTSKSWIWVNYKKDILYEACTLCKYWKKPDNVFTAVYCLTRQGSLGPGSPHTSVENKQQEKKIKLLASALDPLFAHVFYYEHEQTVCLSCILIHPHPLDLPSNTHWYQN